MKIECDSCGATYEIAENAIPAEGREVQCAKCDNVWLQMPPVAEEASEPLALEPTAEVAEPPAAEEPTDLQAAIADNLPDAQSPITEEVAEILEDEAEFAREQREAPAEAEVGEATAAAAAASPLESLRKRVISETPTSEPESPAEEPVAEQPVEAAAPEMPEPVQEEASAPIPRPFGAQQPVEETVEDQVSDAAMTQEPAAEAPKPAASSFRRLGAKRAEPASDPTPDPIAAPAETAAAPTATAPETATDQAAPATATEPAAPAPAAPPQPKRKRQSLADISAQTEAPQIEVTDLPASKPFDLGPAKAEERPETPLETDTTKGPIAPLHAEPVAKPDMSPDAIAQRALEELNAIDVKPDKPKRTLAGGFAVGLLLIVVLLFLYSFGGLIGDAIPGAKGFFDAYRGAIDSVFDAIGIDFAAIGRTINGWLEALQ